MLCRRGLGCTLGELMLLGVQGSDSAHVDPHGNNTEPHQDRNLDGCTMCGQREW